MQQQQKIPNDDEQTDSSSKEKTSLVSLLDANISTANISEIRVVVLIESIIR